MTTPSARDLEANFNSSWHLSHPIVCHQPCPGRRTISCFCGVNQRRPRQQIRQYGEYYKKRSYHYSIPILKTASIALHGAEGAKLVPGGGKPHTDDNISFNNRNNNFRQLLSALIEMFVCTLFLIGREFLQFFHIYSPQSREIAKKVFN